MFFYLAIGLIAILSGVNFCARFFVTNTITFSSTLSTGKVSITLRTVTLGISKSVEFPTLIPYHFVPLPFWERVIFCTWDIFHAIIVTNSSYRTVACKVVQRSLGKSPAKSFVQELSLWKKYQYRAINYSNKKTIVLFWAATLYKLLLLLLFELFKFALHLHRKNDLFFMNKDNYVRV